jgi:DNA-directed RNA polymerase subunit RPC12/RpoP
MTIEIIGRDEKHVKEVSCRNCASRLRYTIADTIEEKHTDYTGDSDVVRVLHCVKCNNKIIVSR